MVSKTTVDILVFDEKPILPVCFWDIFFSIKNEISGKT